MEGLQPESECLYNVLILRFTLLVSSAKIGRFAPSFAMFQIPHMIFSSCYDKISWMCLFEIVPFLRCGILFVCSAKKHVIEKPGVSPSADGDQLTQLDRASWSQLDRLSAFGSSPDKLQFISPAFQTEPKIRKADAELSETLHQPFCIM